ncbi:MarR family winged helix-turn-helix transcriptional regulator [Amycolatopsis sp.]|uniref:MarR family winged helix-turn-helix transcriptional regulator n=1 Tax=Amycolatopsis sp. TaxID=37632 RepID=UPI002B97F9EC|nr:MarR family transcriptional regulator [Amycolatopsis sp.]HVV08566.1 MarR family transcriptional regulator [Amycolatopsis sp.]
MDADARELSRLFATASLGAPEKAVGFVLWRVLHRYVREIDHALAPLDLTHLQFTTLTMAAWLGRAGEPVTQAALARFGDIHPMQVSHMLKALEGKGMVTRPRSTTDVRTKHVRVTATGVAVLRDALPVAIEVQQRLFGTGDELLTRLLAVEESAETWR